MKFTSQDKFFLYTLLLYYEKGKGVLKKPYSAICFQYHRFCSKWLASDDSFSGDLVMVCVLIHKSVLGRLEYVYLPNVVLLSVVIWSESAFYSV